MKKMILGLSLIFGSTLCAALPPLAQHSRELQKILSDPILFEYLGSAGQLHSILKTENGYLFMTQDSALRVDVEYLHSGVWGPVPFQLHFFDPLGIEESRDQSWEDLTS